MSQHARVEEVDTSDEELGSDPSEMDPSEFDPSSIIAPAKIPSTVVSTRSNNPQSLPTRTAQPLRQPQTNPQFLAADRERTKSYQCLYPVYFDASRSRQQGRRVSSSLAVHNPLARTLVDAIMDLGISGSQIVFELSKTHPSDWANPGRVRVNLSACPPLPGSTSSDSKATKRRLYSLVATYLQQHPTTEKTPAASRFQGMTDTDAQYREPAIPKGVKIGKILPLHSPALSGGGVSADFFKDVVQGLQGAGPGALPGRGGNGMDGPPDMADMMSGMGGMGGMADMLKNMSGGGMAEAMKSLGGMGGMGGMGQSSSKTITGAKKGRKK